MEQAQPEAILRQGFQVRRQLRHQLVPAQLKPPRCRLCTANSKSNDCKFINFTSQHSHHNKHHKTKNKITNIKTPLCWCSMQQGVGHSGTPHASDQAPNWGNPTHKTQQQTKNKHKNKHRHDVDRWMDGWMGERSACVCMCVCANRVRCPVPKPATNINRDGLMARRWQRRGWRHRRDGRRRHCPWRHCPWRHDSSRRCGDTWRYRSWGWHNPWRPSGACSRRAAVHPLQAFHDGGHGRQGAVHQGLQRQPRHVTVRVNAAQHNTTQHNTTQHDTTRRA